MPRKKKQTRKPKPGGKLGRNALPPEARKRTLSLSVDPLIYAEIEKRAKAAGLNRSQFIAGLIASQM